MAPSVDSTRDGAINTLFPNVVMHVGAVPDDVYELVVDHSREGGGRRFDEVVVQGCCPTRFGFEQSLPVYIYIYVIYMSGRLWDGLGRSDV